MLSSVVLCCVVCCIELPFVVLDCVVLLRMALYCNVLCWVARFFLYNATLSCVVLYCFVLCCVV